MVVLRVLEFNVRGGINGKRPLEERFVVKAHSLESRARASASDAVADM